VVVEAPSEVVSWDADVEALSCGEVESSIAGTEVAAIESTEVICEESESVADVGREEFESGANAALTLATVLLAVELESAGFEAPALLLVLTAESVSLVDDGVADRGFEGAAALHLSSMRR